MTTITDAQLAALAGHDNAEEILAVLAEAEPEMHGAEWDATGGTLPELAEALNYNVQWLARWRTERETLWQGERPAALSTSDRTSEGRATGWDSLAHHTAHDKLATARDRAAFPYLFDAKGRRTRLDGRQAKANMGKVRARMA